MIEGTRFAARLVLDRLSVSPSTRPLAFSDAASTQSRRLGMQRLAGSLEALGDSLERLRASAAAAPRARGPRLSAPRAISSSELGLEATATPTTLRSSEEVNTTPTSFSTFAPDVDGDSTSQPVISGVYDGAQGDDVLSFQIRDNATVDELGLDRLRVRVRDGNGNTIKNLDFRFQPAGTPLAIGNGLYLALGAGEVEKNDTFTVSVFTSVGSAVDADLPFDGTLNQNPNLEPGQSVVAGSFEVNGVVIDVSASDTLNGVLAKISASDAGVDASFDVATESVVLTQRTLGSQPNIVVGNDTSGFLSASKLDSALAVPGIDGSVAERPIAEMPPFAGVSDGAFLVNGTSISVDVDVDSLSDIAERITESEAGASAYFDSGSDKFVILSKNPNQVLELAGNGNGFLAAVKIADGSYLNSKPTKQGSKASAGFVEDFALVRRNLNRIFSDSYAGLNREVLADLRGQIEASVGSAFTRVGEQAGTIMRSELGVAFDFGRGGTDVFDFDRDRLNRSLGDDFDAVFDFLFEDRAGAAEGEAGLFPELGRLVSRFQSELSVEADIAGAVGLLFDLRA